MKDTERTDPSELPADPNVPDEGDRLFDPFNVDLDPNYPDDCHCWSCGVPESRGRIRYIEISEYRRSGVFPRPVCESCIQRLLADGYLGYDETTERPATFKFEAPVGWELEAKTLRDMLSEIEERTKQIAMHGKPLPNKVEDNDE